MTRALIGFASLVVVAAACSDGGNGSGVDGNKRLTMLNDGELRNVCTYITDLEGPERTVDCGNGQTITLGYPNGRRAAEIDECVASGLTFRAEFPNCENTVAEVEACYEALDSLTDQQICGDTAIPAACDVLFEPSVACGGGQA